MARPSLVCLFLLFPSCDTPAPSTVPPTSAARFEQYGVIEGFYGRPWSHQDRLDVLEFMGRVGLNTYYYAPKNDPYHRDRWREPYPPDQLRRLSQLVRTAHAEGVDFYYAISPGLSMVYSDPAEWHALQTKIDAIFGLGVRHFALMLDDVPARLTHPADSATFRSLADAHGRLIDQLDRYLRARGGVLAVTPTTYTDAWGDRTYLRQLAQSVGTEVALFWTGPDVASPQITAANALAWTRLTGRPPLIWDNYPVNDYARWRVFLGPLRGRAADLPDVAAGIVANPMNQAHASMLPLATLADYARHPDAYDPERSWQEAVSALYGPDAAALLRPFLEIYGDYEWDQNLFEPLFVPGLAIDVPRIKTGLARLDTALAALRGAAFAHRVALTQFLREVEPVVSTTRTRLQELEQDRDYERLGPTLVYRASLDRISVARASAPLTIDGMLDDWKGVPARELYESGRSSSKASVQLAWDDHYLYIALRARDDGLAVRDGPMLGEADHVALVVAAAADDSLTHIGARDAVWLLPPPAPRRSPDPLLLSLDFHGFMARNIEGRRNLRFSEFLVTSLGTPPPQSLSALASDFRYDARPSPGGYQAELAVPRNGANRFRLTLVVADAALGGWTFHSLPRRNYPGNPATFAEIVLER